MEPNQAFLHCCAIVKVVLDGSRMYALCLELACKEQNY